MKTFLKKDAAVFLNNTQFVASLTGRLTAVVEAPENRWRSPIRSQRELNSSSVHFSKQQADSRHISIVTLLILEDSFLSGFLAAAALLLHTRSYCHLRSWAVEMLPWFADQKSIDGDWRPDTLRLLIQKTRAGVCSFPCSACLQWAIILLPFII